MRRRALLIGLLAPMALDPALVRAGGIGTVASFSILADMVRRMGDGLVNVVSLVPADADAHAYQPTAGDSRALTAASLAPALLGLLATESVWPVLAFGGGAAIFAALILLLAR